MSEDTRLDIYPFIYFRDSRCAGLAGPELSNLQVVELSQPLPPECCQTDFHTEQGKLESWRMVEILVLGWQRQGDHLNAGVPGQPGQHRLGSPKQDEKLINQPTKQKPHPFTRNMFTVMVNSFILFYGLRPQVPSPRVLPTQILTIKEDEDSVTWCFRYLFSA